MGVPRLLLFCLALLVLLYLAKVWLLYIVMEPVMGGGKDNMDDESADSGEGEAPAGTETANRTDPYHAARKKIRAQAYGDALEVLRTCQEGDCVQLLGEMHLIGAGVPRNLTKALELFEKAADVGNPDAQYALGILYASLVEGQGPPKEREVLAVLYLYAASTAGHPGALMAMGYRHMQGYGVPKACTTAALNYIEVAKKIADIYSAGMPQAVELIRLGLQKKDRKTMSSSEINLFMQIASSGDTGVAAAIGKRYLLGIDGFKQNYKKALQYLRIASEQQHAGALALLGYMYCLGLGVEKNLDIAYSYFVSSSIQNDALGHNGLGYIYFHGTTIQARNLKLAHHHFNESAYGGSADGMFNLASMYLTGTGTDQSFQKAVLWYTQALDRGHTPAAYSLAVMHLNGVGTVRDCDIAVNLLKKVCERGEWVSSKLVEAYDGSEGQPELTAFLFLKLAEAGHEVAQMNVAHLLDSGQAWLLQAGAIDEDPTEEQRLGNKISAQRFYEMSAEQGSASSELRLGDYAYYGWGLAADVDDSETESENELVKIDVPDSLNSLDDELSAGELEIKFVRQPIDYAASLAHYRKTSEMQITGEWMQTFVARASFNLGFMHQFGFGVSQDLHLARRHYQRCLEIDPSGVHTPITVMLILLTAHAWFLDLPPNEKLQAAFMNDQRSHFLVMQLIMITVFVFMRRYFTAVPVRRGSVPQMPQAPARLPGPAQREAH